MVFFLEGMDTLAAILAALNRVKELDQLATRLMAIRYEHLHVSGHPGGAQQSQGTGSTRHQAYGH
jgi:hypothetical protein